MAVQNYGNQSYDPTKAYNIPSRNYCCGSLSLTSGTTATLFRFDCIVIHRGGVVVTGGVTPISPAAGLILTVHANVDASGATFMPQEDFGDGTMRDMLTSAINWPVGVNEYQIRLSCFHVRGRVTRVSGTTTVIFHASITGY